MAQPQPGVISTQQPRAVPRPGFEDIADRERVTDNYWTCQDPIRELRSSWRAQIVRHIFHLLPSETILEIGCGSGSFTRALARATRRECSITAATFRFADGIGLLTSTTPEVETVLLSDFPGELRGRKFDYIVGNNLLDLKNAAWLLQEIQNLLRPGGRLLLFETNPWNPVFQLRRWLSTWLPFVRRGDERSLPNQIQLYELLSEIGFICIAATCYDFLYRPIPRWFMLIARNLSLVLENTPGLRR